MTTSVTTGLRFRVIFISWWLVWTAIQTMVISSYGNAITQSLADSFLCNLLLAACCMLVINNMKFYLPQKERYWYLLIMSVVLSSLWLVIVKFVLRFLFKSDQQYLVFLDLSIYIRFVIGFLMIGCMAIMSLLWYTLQEQQEAERRKEQAEQMTKDAELLKLRQQLQPHFLFNSLNSISALAGSQPEKARHMIQQLSDFLRGTLKRDEQQSVSLEEELHHLQLYLDIEKVRFGSRLQTDIQVAEGVKKMMIPALLLQPIVENAIKFGLYDTTGEVMITLHAATKDQQLALTITNPFDEETAVSTQGTGFGLASIQRRLYLLFARHDLLNTSKTANIFTTTLLIPQYRYESNNH
jgi:two-component system LytT family sensor kinase